tara:strand:+ start:312 stop:548 length:237 start_codon:yes stop_codon:yes gene_type:complete
MIKVCVALLMIVNGSIDGHMYIPNDSIANCLKLKREALRNLSEARSNQINYKCSFVEAKFKTDHEGNLKIDKIIKEIQ